MRCRQRPRGNQQMSGWILVPSLPIKDSSRILGDFSLNEAFEDHIDDLRFSNRSCNTFSPILDISRKPYHRLCCRHSSRCSGWWFIAFAQLCVSPSMRTQDDPNWRDDSAGIVQNHPNQPEDFPPHAINLYGGFPKNGGTPKMILILLELSLINHPAIGVPMFMETFIKIPLWEPPFMETNRTNYGKSPFSRGKSTINGHVQ